MLDEVSAFTFLVLFLRYLRSKYLLSHCFPSLELVVLSGIIEAPEPELSAFSRYNACLRTTLRGKGEASNLQPYINSRLRHFLSLQMTEVLRSILYTLVHVGL